MYRAKCHLKSVSPVSFSRRFEDKPDKKLDPWDHQKKNWRNRVHTNGNSECIIPAMMFKGALVNAAKISGENIPGKGHMTYTSRFKAGVIVENDLCLGIKKAKVGYEDVYVDSQGGRGGSQILKRFPKIREWEGDVVFTVVLDKLIQKKVFQEYIQLAGMIAGVGRYRPERGGNYGRFAVDKIEFEEIKT